jgi:hypothetical protein
VKLCMRDVCMYVNFCRNDKLVPYVHPTNRLTIYFVHILSQETNMGT